MLIKKGYSFPQFMCNLSFMNRTQTILTEKHKNLTFDYGNYKSYQLIDATLNLKFSARQYIRMKSLLYDPSVPWKIQ